MRTKYQEQRERLRRKWMKPATLEFTKLDFSDRITDQILESPFDRMSIGTNPETKFLITKNEIQRTLAHQLMWDGEKWVPHSVAVEKYPRKVIDTGWTTIAAGESVTPLDIKGYAGVIHALSYSTNSTDVTLNLTIDDLPVRGLRGGMEGVLFIFFEDMITSGENDGLVQLMHADTVNDRYLACMNENRTLEYRQSLNITINNGDALADHKYQLYMIYTMGAA